ncbi:MAG TPA: AMP-binding protein, partial [Actinomycetota bacterium]|nr:AMP-binding protein [Actinomycetota bacterium]
RVPYHRDDVVLCPAPLFHSFGLATLTFATALGSTIVLPDWFDPEDSLRLIEQHRATAASFVPVMLRRIVSLDQPARARYDLSSLRIVMASGSVLSTDLRKAVSDLMGDVLYDLYGSTEVGWVAIATPEDIRTRPQTVGRPVEGIDIAVFATDGRRLPTGETGELFVKSEVQFEGYTSGESKDEREGFMAIGDLGRIDGDGYLYVESRSDDMVVVGGENIYPIEVEQVIESVPGVEEVTVLGVADEEYGQVLAAFVVGDADLDGVRARCEAELASYKVPKRIERLEELPRTSTGKVVKRDLIAQLEAAEPLP